MKNYSNILKSPRITEKGAITADANAYIFNLDTAATKDDVKKAMKLIYKVEPIKVNIVSIKPKKKFTRGKRGATAGGKKAYVYLKKGEQIQIM